MHTQLYVHFMCSLLQSPCSQACAKEGAQVIATDVNAEKLAELQGIEGQY